MKLLFAYYVPSGGVETLARQRNNALKKYGIQFDFLYFQYGKGIQNLANEKFFITKEIDGFKKILKEGNYDAIVVCSDHEFVQTVRELGYEGKIIFEIQGLGSYTIAEHWLKLAQPFIHQNADALLYPNTPHLIQLAKKYYPELKHYCFHNCLDNSLFRYQDLPSPLNPVIGWVGRIEDNKNWRELLEIVSRLKKPFPNVELWLFEDASLSHPAERALFQKKLDELELRTSTTFHDNIPHHKMAEYYSMIGCSGGFLCSTSKVEGFGYAVLEAMSCKCPVLSSDSDGVKSFVIHNHTGKMYTLGDIESAITEAQDLMENTELRREIIHNALDGVNKSFSPYIYAKNFMEMLSNLIG